MLSGPTEEVKDVKKEGEQPAEVKPEVKVEPMETAEVKVEEKPSSPLSVRAMKDELQELQAENKRLHNMVTDLHQRHHENTLKVSISIFSMTCFFFKYEGEARIK